MKEATYSNVFAGQEAIEVQPWILFRVRLLVADEVPGAVGPVLEFNASENEFEDNPLIHAIPSGFVTAQFMELDLSSDEGIAEFCGQWGLVASPYAGSIGRAHERLLDPGAEARLLQAEYDAYEEVMPGDARSIDFERLGRDVWYSGLNNSKLDSAYTAHLDGSCWLNAFKRDSSSKGSEVLNARRFAEGGAAGNTYVYVEEVRQTLAIMRIAVLYHGFLELAKGDASCALGKARRYDDGVERGSGHRPFEEALALFMCSTDFLHMPAKNDIEKGVREEVFRQQAEVINDNTMLFAELCLNTAPVPLISHSGFRRGSLRTAKMPSGLNRWGYGTLLNAMSAQLYAYLNDGNPWHSCEVCGRPFKYEQQRMSPVMDEDEARKAYARRHRATKTEFCSKRHEKKVYDKRSKEYRSRIAGKSGGARA